MPELPEVETIRRGLYPLLRRKVTGVYANDPLLFNSPLTVDRAEELLLDQELIDLQRYGKYLALKFSASWLIFHPRMSGKVQLQSDSPKTPDRVKLRLDFAKFDRSLYFTSVRRFSQFYWWEKENLLEFSNFSTFGPDPFHADYSWDNFYSRSQNRTIPIKNLLLDQKFIVGVGNIDASEACFRAGIDPRKKTSHITKRRLKKIFFIVPKILHEAVIMRGSSLNPESSATAYRDASNRFGGYRQFHRVYAREGEFCLDCSEKIKKIKQSGRSSYFCPGCQQ